MKPACQRHSMSRYHAPDSNDQQPLMWLGGHALHAAHLIVLVYVVSMFITTACMAFGFSAPFAWLPYTSVTPLAWQRCISS